MDHSSDDLHPESEKCPADQRQRDLSRIEWMLTNPSDRIDGDLIIHSAISDREENEHGLIIDAVGKNVLERILVDTLTLLGTTAAVYEKDGTCSMCIFSSCWCKYQETSYRNADKGNEEEAEGFLCHHHRWSGSTQLIQEANGPVDRPCPGGLRIYAVPIWARGEIIGSINIGYGNPPQDPQDLLQMADDGHLNREQFIKAVQSYRSRPPFIVEAAKSRLRTSAQLIGVIVEKQFAEIEAEERARELSRSNKELEQFAYIASHDLKEPLRMVLSYLALLEKKSNAVLDDDAKEFMGFAIDGARRMDELIDDLLLYSRIDRNPNLFEPVDMEEVFEIATTNLEVSIKDTGTKLTHDALPQMMGDRRQMIQLLQNLISNALKFHNGGTPEVHVSASALGNDWKIAVRDNGIGISPEQSDRVFQMFRRLHTREEYPGNGMGLAISKKIVERHGGRIWFESEPGRGTTFFFTVPIPSRAS